ncbi:MAG: vWA domain-containing protein, partial [Bacteroidia bacterium]
DAASYSNMRRFLKNGQLPPPDAVRIEEMINYFNYSYPQPTGEHPFHVFSEMASCPWNPEHKLVHIGIQGKIVQKENLPASNLVFLIDVSGSMSSPDKLPLVKQSLKLLTNELRKDDKVAIVVYAGAAGLVLPSTKGNDKNRINEALDELEAGGSTAGGAGIQLAYNIAKENFVTGGNNRVILATDGDFNVGQSSEGDLVRLIEEKRQDGIFLTVLGYGTGNYQDSKMQELADKGNGNHAYIDDIMEAKKVLVNEFGGTLFTIAKDVKLQVEWNPALVKGYRLIGYENRMLNKEDFNDDKKDAGELGSGHTVTALYEIIPAGAKEEPDYKVDSLKYQTNIKPDTTSHSNEIFTLKLRYKQPDGNKSKLLSYVLTDENTAFASASENLRWSSTVAAFGLLLRDSKYKGTTDYKHVIDWAKAAKGKDENGYRSEFIQLAEVAELYAKKSSKK